MHRLGAIAVLPLLPLLVPVALVLVLQHNLVAALLLATLVRLV